MGFFGGSSKSTTVTTNQAFDQRQITTIDDRDEITIDNSVDDADRFDLDESIRESFNTELDDGAIQAGGDVSVVGLEGDLLSDFLDSTERIAEQNIDLLDRVGERQAGLAEAQIKAGSSALGAAFQNTSAGLLDATSNAIRIIAVVTGVVFAVRAFKGRAA